MDDFLGTGDQEGYDFLQPTRNGQLQRNTNSPFYTSSPTPANARSLGQDIAWNNTNTSTSISRPNDPMIAASFSSNADQPSDQQRKQNVQSQQISDRVVMNLFEEAQVSTANNLADKGDKQQYMSSLLVSSGIPSKTPNQIVDTTPKPSTFGIYSSTGFDLLTLLSCIVNRPNPVVQLGPVDLSCSFLVTDARKPDCPIVYVSPQFEVLTGYTTAELIGTNCRFLQDPSGSVVKGRERNYCDNGIIYQMKKAVTSFKESQFTLINYKKTGEPFMNYLTLIPICMDGSGINTHFVGLQVDLVNQPQAILEKMRDGTYFVNYSNPIPTRPRASPARTQAPSTANKPETPTTESAKYPESAPLPRFMSSWPETFPDLVHVVSFRGLILYVSPDACRSVLGYEPSALVRKNINEFIHPADFVTVMRELRTCPPNGTVNYLCRMRKKQNGYVYMQTSGHMYHWGKRTRCFILSSREFSYAPRHVSRSILSSDPYVEICGWMKVTREGLILFATSDCETILQQSLEFVTGQYMLDFVAKEYKLLVLEYLRKVADSFAPSQDPSSFPVTAVSIVSGQICSMRFFAYSEGLSTAVLVQVRQPLDPEATLSSLMSTSSPSGPESEQVENLFDFMEETCTSSVQFELNRLKMNNKRLQAELERFDLSSPS